MNTETIKKERTPKEASKVIEKALNDINAVFNAVSVLKSRKIFDPENFSHEDYIKGVCKKLDVPIKQVKKIGNWGSKYVGHLD